MFQDQLKRFFYRIRIRPYNSTSEADFVELPESILRLISDVTISESSYSDTEATYPSLNITLNETLYSPAPGSILDLRFDSEKGFSYVSKDEMESGLYRSRRTPEPQTQPVVFLFAGNNRLEIEWGLLDPKTSAKREFTIQTLSLSGGGTGHGTVTITAMDGTLQGRKFNIDKGIVYRNKDGSIMSLKQVLYDVTKAMNHRLIFDNEFVANRPPNFRQFVANRTQTGGDTAPADPNVPIVQAKGMNFHEFIIDLANEYSSSYEYINDPATGVPVLVFTFRETRYKSTQNVFTYKSANDVVLNYKIDSVEGMFNPVTGASSTVDGGEISTGISTLPIVLDDTKTTGSQQKPKEKVQQPADPNDVSRTKDTLDRNYVGQSVTTPAKSPEAVQNEAESLYNKHKYNTSISLTTLGNPAYRPGLIQMENIGRRYSKKYRMFTVQHKLNNSGYICTWSGLSHYETEAGINPDDAAKDNSPASVLELVKQDVPPA